MHPVEQKRRIGGIEWRVVGQRAQQLHCPGRLKPVAILQSRLTMQIVLAVHKMKPLHPQAGYVVVNSLRATRKPQQNIRRRIVAQRGR